MSTQTEGPKTDEKGKKKNEKKRTFRVFSSSLYSAHSIHLDPRFVFFVFSSGHQPSRPSLSSHLPHLILISLTYHLLPLYPPNLSAALRNTSFFSLRYNLYFFVFWHPPNIYRTSIYIPTWPSTRNAPQPRLQPPLQPASIPGAKARMATSWQARVDSPQPTRLPSSHQ